MSRVLLSDKMPPKVKNFVIQSITAMPGLGTQYPDGRIWVSDIGLPKRLQKYVVKNPGFTEADSQAHAVGAHSDATADNDDILELLESLGEGSTEE